MSRRETTDAVREVTINIFAEHSRHLAQQRRERTERGRLMALTGTMIQAWTGQGDCAKEGAEGARLLAFDAERIAAVVTLGAGGDKG